MANSVHNQILTAIQRKGRGNLFFPSNFLEFGSNDAIRKAFSRLTVNKVLVRLGQGIYLYPQYDPELGMLYPSTEQIAEAIAKRDKARIIPAGANALNKLGLSTQVPMKTVYLTDGAPRKIKVGNRTITFKITTPKKLATKGKISSLVVQAFHELGKKHVDDKVITRVKTLLRKEDKSVIRHDAKLASAWIAEILFSSIKEAE